MSKISVIIPAYNEEKAIGEVLKNLEKELTVLGLDFELIVVNDGSSDKTGALVTTSANIRLINHPYNKGYGAALKTGAREAKYDWLLFFDADGQHNASIIRDFLNYTDKYDMIVGLRTGYRGPFIRQPGKKILQWVANYLVDKNIPDINCGLRLVKRDLYLKYLHILPNTFSASTTITMIFFKEGLNIKYVPLEINKRIGQSRVRPYDAAKTLLLILRVIMLFNPLKFFIPIAVFFFGLAAIIFIAQISQAPEIFISKSVSMLFLASVFMFCFGLLADQIAAIRREIK